MLLRAIFVFSCAKMTPPARPTASLAPICSGCQCVLISVWMRAAAGRALDRREQRVGIGREAAIDHQRALRTGHRDHVAAGTLEQRRAAEIGGRDARPARAKAAALQPPSAAAPMPRETTSDGARRRETPQGFGSCRKSPELKTGVLVEAYGSLSVERLVDRLVNRGSPSGQMSSQTPCGGPSTGHTGLFAISLVAPSSRRSCASSL